MTPTSWLFFSPAWPMVSPFNLSSLINETMDNGLQGKSPLKCGTVGPSPSTWAVLYISVFSAYFYITDFWLAHLYESKCQNNAKKIGKTRLLFTTIAQQLSLQSVKATPVILLFPWFCHLILELLSGLTRLSTCTHKTGFPQGLVNRLSSRGNSFELSCCFYSQQL